MEEEQSPGKEKSKPILMEETAGEDPPIVETPLSIEEREPEEPELGGKEDPGERELQKKKRKRKHKKKGTANPKVEGDKGPVEHEVEGENDPEAENDPESEGEEVTADPKAEGEVTADPKAEGEVTADPKAVGKVTADPKAEGEEVTADPKAEGEEVTADPKAEGDEVTADPKADTLEPEEKLEVSDANKEIIPVSSSTDSFGSEGDDSENLDSNDTSSKDVSDEKDSKESGKPSVNTPISTGSFETDPSELEEASLMSPNSGKSSMANETSTDSNLGLSPTQQASQSSASKTDKSVNSESGMGSLPTTSSQGTGGQDSSIGSLKVQPPGSPPTTSSSGAASPVVAQAKDIPPPPPPPNPHMIDNDFIAPPPDPPVEPEEIEMVEIRRPATTNPPARYRPEPAGPGGIWCFRTYKRIACTIIVVLVAFIVIVIAGIILIQHFFPDDSEDDNLENINPPTSTLHPDGPLDFDFFKK